MLHRASLHALALIFAFTTFGIGFAMEQTDQKEELDQELATLRDLNPWKCLPSNIETHVERCACLLKLVILAPDDAQSQHAQTQAILQNNRAKLTPMKIKQSVASFVYKTLGYGGATCTLPIACEYLLTQCDVSIDPVPRPVFMLGGAFALIGLSAVVSPIDDLYSNGLSALQKIVAGQASIAQQLDGLRKRGNKEKTE